MAKSKKLDLKSYSKHVNAITKLGETIRTRQDEKQAVLDDFDKEKKSYRHGKISETTLRNSSKKVNKELRRLTDSISDSMSNVRTTAKQLLDLTARQRPIHYSASVKGIKKAGSSRKKKTSKKKK